MNSQPEDESVVIIGPGTYEVAPEGSITIYGARHVELKGCTLAPLQVIAD